MTQADLRIAVRAVQGGLVADLADAYWGTVYDDRARTEAYALEAVDRLEALLSTRLDWNDVWDLVDAIAPFVSTIPRGTIGVLGKAENALKGAAESASRAAGKARR